MKHLTRRTFAFGAVLLPFLAERGFARTALPKMTVSKDPNCGCCGGWVDYLRADPTKAREKLGWRPSVSFGELVQMMVEADLKAEGLSPAHTGS